MRLRCPNCGEIVNRVRGSYIIAATSDLRFTYDRNVIKPAVGPLEIVEGEITVHQVTCPACNHIDKLDNWTVVLQCPSCGDRLAEYQASTSIQASQWYCKREGNFLCRKCTERYNSCGTCSERAHCQIVS